MHNFKDILNVIKDFIISYDDNSNNFSYLSYDSNDIKEDTLFFCKGKTFKKEYLKVAITKGVTCYISEIDYEVNIPKIIVSDITKVMALVGECFYNDKTYNKTIIGITGTKGKTTVLKLLNNIINTYTKIDNPYLSTIDYYTGKTHGKSLRTTPESIDIYKCIKDMQESNLKYLTMEVSSQATKLNRIYNMNFDYGLFLNIGIDHISPDEHQDFSDYLNCKIEFLKQCRNVIIYKQTDYYDVIINELKDLDINIYTFGTTPDCDFYIDIKDKGFMVNNEYYEISLVGDFNMLNAGIAASCAKLLNVGYEDIKKGIENLKVAGRMELIIDKKCPILVDYAHNKLSMEAVFSEINKIYPHANIKLVMGCPGGRGYNRRLDVAEICKDYNIYLYLTEDDPHNESLEDILEEVSHNLNNLNVSYEVIKDRSMAIKKAYNDAKETDVIAILGKGHEDGQIRKDEVIYPYLGDLKVVESLKEE